MNIDKPYFFLIILLLSILSIGTFLNLAIGYSPIPAAILWDAFIGHSEKSYQIIFWDIRLPRALLSIFVGFSLGLSGAALQGLLRNPLAEPGIIGVSATAGLGGVIALYFGFAALSIWLLPLFSMIFALLSVGLIFLLSGRESSILTLILAGVAISSLAMAVTSLVMNLAPNPWAVTEMLFWLMGSLKDRSMTDIYMILPFIVIGSLLILSTYKPLNILTLGEETARTMGIDMIYVNLKLVLGTALIIGSSVAAVGNIGFIGLVVPHLLRPFVGYQPGKLLIVSGIGGAVLLSFSDILVRLIPFRQELNIGVVTALIGAPFFLYLVLKTRRNMR